MRLSNRGLDIIKKYSGFRNHPYLSKDGIPMIGYGATFYEDGTPVRLNDSPITKKRAEAILLSTLKHFERDVLQVVKQPLEQHEFDALVSFTYQYGRGKLETSTLLKKVNRNPKDNSIEFEFKKWVFNGQGFEDRILRKRRNEEVFLYNGG